MKNNSYSTTIEAEQPADKVFNAINDVTNWWSKDFAGSSTKLNDEFIIDHAGMHYSKQRLVEVIPDKKIAWLVTASKLNWINGNKEEWTNTKMIFEISSKGDLTVLHFTHEGLVPGKECYAMCEKGWNIVINDWLLHLINTGTPSAAMAKAAEIRTQHFDQPPATENKDYHRTIVVKASPDESMKKISQVNLWWRKDFSGRAEKLHDTFTVPFGEHNGETAFVDFVVSEFVPNQKVTWKVRDCNLPWFSDKKEWNNTEVVFQLSEEQGNTTIGFTHIGLVPAVECYTACEKGWDGHVTRDLEKFINEGKAIPQ